MQGVCVEQPERNSAMIYLTGTTFDTVRRSLQRAVASSTDALGASQVNHLPSVRREAAAKRHEAHSKGKLAGDLRRIGHRLETGTGDGAETLLKTGVHVSGRLSRARKARVAVAFALAPVVAVAVGVRQRLLRGATQPHRSPPRCRSATPAPLTMIKPSSSQQRPTRRIPIPCSTSSSTPSTTHYGSTRASTNYASAV